MSKDNTTMGTDEATAAHTLSSSEAVLWAIERDPTLRSTIVVVALLAQPPDLRLRERLVSAVHAVHGYGNGRPRRTGVPRWVDAGHLVLDHHLRRVQLPPPGSMADLLRLAGQQAGEAFDDRAPLWQMTVVEGLDGGRAAVVIKVHHAVTDGVGGVGLLPVFTDPEPCPNENGATSANGREASRPPSSGRPGLGLLGSVGSALGEALSHPVSAADSAPASAVDRQAAGSCDPGPESRHHGARPRSSPRHAGRPHRGSGCRRAIGRRDAQRRVPRGRRGRVAPLPRAPRRRTGRASGDDADQHSPEG